MGHFEMTKKSICIDFEYDYDFLLIGICSPLKDYQLCYKLNQELNASLGRSEFDIAMSYDDGLEKAYFSLYEYWNDQYQNQWYLITNKCQIECTDENQKQGTIFDGFIQSRKKVKYLIPENSKVDYYIQVHGIFNDEAKISLLKNIKTLDRVVSTHEIDMMGLRSKENLIIK
jgi:hypothetical protein